MRSMVEGAFGIQVPPSVSFAATSPASQGRTTAASMNGEAVCRAASPHPRHPINPLTSQLAQKELSGRYYVSRAPSKPFQE